MTAFDDELARALRDVPVGGYAPIEELQDRARQLHTRRRLAGAGLAVAAAVLVAVSSALALTGGDGDTVTPAPPVGTAPSSTPEPTTAPPAGPDCPGTWSERFDATQPRSMATPVAGPGDLPDEVRLLWAADAAPDPDQAYAMDNSSVLGQVGAAFERCPQPQPDRSVVVVQLDGDVVQRSAVISEAGSWLRVDPATARTLDADGVPVLVENPDASADDGVRAEWEAGGLAWEVQSEDLSDAELIELVRTMRLDGDSIDLSAWSVATGAERFVTGAGVDVEPGRADLTVVADGLQLTVTDEDRDPWRTATPGSREVAVAGGTGVLREVADGVAMLTWQPTPRTTATLTGDLDGEELLAIARTVAPVPADDQRLTEVWSAGAEQ
ncbi:hypothetical protein E1262_21055 [Jiangella aurantiaca]|uniref:Uncharacterized protein n=1 Tax=Jiangella aurantiaca TaxID=2530373 RepID=A0A4R5A4K0_9ACTN|nr:hypothetical protein [Jiangella aurantiaca]TDD66821.1 hypothetical protein E1262_21055 [Jiangella aurantiaca]